MKKGTHRNGGFTLAELLVVVAIIGVLVAVAIPVFSVSMEKSKETVDISNIRGAYSNISMDAVSNNGSDIVETITLKQEKDGWQTSGIESTLSSIGIVVGGPTEGGCCEVSWSTENNKVVFNFVGLRIAFPNKNEKANWAKSYAELIDQYIKKDVITHQKLNGKMQTYNEHGIVGVFNGDGNFNTTVSKQASDENYSNEIINILAGKSGLQYTAYFDAEYNLLAYTYCVDEKISEGSTRTQSLRYVVAADGSVILSGTQGRITDAASKQAIADYYWPTDSIQ